MQAFAGSDVAGLRTTAVLDESGENYIVNGTKKWITGMRRVPRVLQSSKHQLEHPCRMCLCTSRILPVRFSCVKIGP